MDAQDFDTVVVCAGEIEPKVILWLLLKYVFITIAKMKAQFGISGSAAAKCSRGKLQDHTILILEQDTCIVRV